MLNSDKMIPIYCGKNTFLILIYFLQSANLSLASLTNNLVIVLDNWIHFFEMVRNKSYFAKMHFLTKDKFWTHCILWHKHNVCKVDGEYAEYKRYCLLSYKKCKRQTRFYLKRYAVRMTKIRPKANRMVKCGFHPHNCSL